MMNKWWVRFFFYTPASSDFYHTLLIRRDLLAISNLLDCLLTPFKAHLPSLYHLSDAYTYFRPLVIDIIEAVVLQRVAHVFFSQNEHCGNRYPTTTTMYFFISLATLEPLGLYKTSFSTCLDAAAHHLKEVINIHKTLVPFSAYAFYHPAANT